MLFSSCESQSRMYILTSMHQQWNKKAMPLQSLDCIAILCNTVPKIVCKERRQVISKEQSYSSKNPHYLFAKPPRVPRGLGTTWTQHIVMHPHLKRLVWWLRTMQARFQMIPKTTLKSKSPKYRDAHTVIEFATNLLSWARARPQGSERNQAVFWVKCVVRNSVATLLNGLLVVEIHWDGLKAVCTSFLLQDAD